MPDQFCRDVYQDLCVFAEMQHLRATALISPGNPSGVSSGQHSQHTSSTTFGEGITVKTLDPCAWRYVLKQDDLASFRLKARSNVIGTWEIESTTYNHFYCQVKITVSGCNFKSGKSHFGLQMEAEDSVATKHTRVRLLSPELSRLTQPAFLLLIGDPAPTTGAAKAYRESQSRIFKTDAPLFVGVGEGTDNLDFLADLSALKVIDPDEVNQAIPPWGAACTEEQFTSPRKAEA